MNILRENDKEFKNLGAIRAGIADLRKEIKATEFAPLAAEDMRTRIAKMLDVQKSKGLGDYTFRKIFAVSADKQFPQLGDLDWAMLAAIIGREAVEKRLCELATEAMTAHGLQSGLPLSEREERIATLRNQLRDQERAEILEMLRLQDAGWDVLPRPDTDVELMMQVWWDVAPLPEYEAKAAQAEPVKRRPHVNEGAAVHAPALGAE